MSQVTPAVTPTVTKDRLLDEFNTVVAETEQLLRSAASMGSESAGALKSNVDEVVASAIERLAAIREKSLAQACAAAHATREYVRDNPWHAVGIVAAVAAATGLMAGVLLARRPAEGLDR